MHAQAKDWKRAADQLWADATLDLRAAGQLAAEMARSENAALREAATQALASLRAALVKGADQRTRDVARRRFGAVLNVLHALDAPRFGKRGTPAEVLTADERNRRMLGLPPGRRLFGPEIREAYKRAAKTMHPDGGGSERDFLALSAARDALLKGE
jgi:hypothetical protein